MKDQLKTHLDAIEELFRSKGIEVQTEIKVHRTTNRLSKVKALELVEVVNFTGKKVGDYNSKGTFWLEVGERPSPEITIFYEEEAK